MSLIKDECDTEYLALIEKFLRENGLALVRVERVGDIVLPDSVELKCEICDMVYDVLKLHWYDDKQCLEKLKSLFRRV